MRAIRALRGWILPGLVPAFFALDLCLPSSDAVPTGIGEALGCSGAGNVAPIEGWTWLRPARSYDDQGSAAGVPVATDGFFAIQAEGNGLSLEQARAQLRVSVTNEAGNELAGELSLLDTPRDGAYLFGWVAREPLAAGEHLTATLATEPATSGAPYVGGQFPLRVAGPPVAPPEPQLMLNDWAKYYQGTGELVRCEQKPSSCGSVDLAVPSEAVEQVAARALSAVSEVPVSVAWRLYVEPGTERASAQVTAAATYYGEAGDLEGYIGLGDVFFSPQAERRYCATLVLQELRTGSERRTQVCAEPVLSGVRGDYRWTSCKEPPSPSMTRAWCELNPRADACAELRNTDTTGNQNPDEAALGAMSSGSEASDSCRFSPSPRASAWPLLAGAFALLVLPVRRLRRRH
jgi:hypothetical protein